MKKYTFLIAMLLLQIAFLNAALAVEDADIKGKVIEKPVAADTPEKFAVVAAKIRTEMQADGRYEFVGPANKAKVEADLDAMAAMLQNAGSVAAMRQDQKVQLFNTQENLNGILTHSDSNRLVCEHHAPVGSHIPLTSCKTVGEIERNRRDVQRYGDHSMTAGGQCASSGPSKGTGAGQQGGAASLGNCVH